MSALDKGIDHTAIYIAHPPRKPARFCIRLDCNYVAWKGGGGGGGGKAGGLAYFIVATHKWHLSKHIFHTSHPLFLLARGKKAYFKCGTSCASNRMSEQSSMCMREGERRAVHTHTHTKRTEQWTELKKCSSRKPSSCFATFEHVKFFKVNMSLAGRPDIRHQTWLTRRGWWIGRGTGWGRAKKGLAKCGEREISVGPTCGMSFASPAIVKGPDLFSHFHLGVLWHKVLKYV